MRYFTNKEFNCPCCNEHHMDFDTIDDLITARTFANIPFIITSAWRCEKHNKEVGGSETSSHLQGTAVDISTPDSRTRFRVIYGLIHGGFKRIGVGTNFVHADTDHNKDEDILWLYKEN